MDYVISAATYLFKPNTVNVLVSAGKDGFDKHWSREYINRMITDCQTPQFSFGSLNIEFKNAETDKVFDIYFEPYIYYDAVVIADWGAGNSYKIQDESRFIDSEFIVLLTTAMRRVKKGGSLYIARGFIPQVTELFQTMFPEFEKKTVDINTDQKIIFWRAQKN